MPVVFRENGFRFHFWSNEGDPREPVHVHVAKPDIGDAKLWLHPDVRFADAGDFDPRTQRWIRNVVEERPADIERAWNEHFDRAG